MHSRSNEHSRENHMTAIIIALLKKQALVLFWILCFLFVFYRAATTRVTVLTSTLILVGCFSLKIDLFLILHKDYNYDRSLRKT